MGISFSNIGTVGREVAGSSPASGTSWWGSEVAKRGGL